MNPHARDEQSRMDERAMLAGVLYDPEAVIDCEEIVSGCTFVDPRNEAMWAAACEITHRGESLTMGTLTRDLVALGMDSTETAGLVMSLRGEGATYTRSDIIAHAQRVRDGAVVRHVRQSAGRIVDVCDTPTSTAVEAIGALNDAMMSSSAAAVTTDDIMSSGDKAFQDAYEAAVARAGKGLPGLSTGSADLDDMTQGLAPGQVIVIGARPAVGKSVQVVDLGRAALRQGAGVLVFSMEMPRDEIMARFISAEASVDYSRMRDGRFSEADHSRIAHAATTLRWGNLYLVDKPSITPGQVTAITRQVRRAFDQQGITDMVVFIDYLQIMGTDATANRNRSRQQELGAICVALKGLAMEVKCPVVTLSQLNRNVDKDREPTMRDLRESGDIEQAADIIILLHRPDVEDAESRPGEIDFLQAKHRQGIAPQIRTRVHQYQYQRTEDMARGQWGEA